MWTSNKGHRLQQAISGLLATLCGLLPLLLGCPAPCEGPGCESTYSAALVGVVSGGALDPTGELDPHETWAELQGSVEQGADWDAVLVPGALLVGIPDSNAVADFDLAAGGSLVFDPEQGRIISTTAGDRLGATLTPVGDYDDDGVAELLVGAPGMRRTEDSVDDGAVLLFSGQGAGLDGQLEHDDATLRIDGAEPGGMLGSVVAACGDVDDDQIDDWATAAPLASTAAAFTGRVVLGGSRGLAHADSPVTASLVPTSWFGTDIGARAGSALACQHDLDGDDIPDLVVGVPFADGDGEARGAVHILRGGEVMDGGGSARLLDNAAAATMWGGSDNTWLGRSLATGDLDGDGLADLVAGGPGASAGAGRVQIWNGTDSGIDPGSPSSISGLAAGDGFGHTVHMADMDGDGLMDLLVGAPFRNPDPAGSEAAFDSGTLYQFSGATGSSTWPVAMTADDATRSWVRAEQYLRTGQRFSTGDFDEDGVIDLVFVHRSDPG